MLVGCLQFTPVFGDRGANLDRIAHGVRGSGADLVVLPELATTGYQFTGREEALALAELVPDGPSIEFLVGLARDENAFLCCGLAERVGDRVANTAVLVGPGGPVLVYRKVHLFWDEFDVFERGDLGFPVATLPGTDVVVGLNICFDWVFPEAARELTLGGADLILHPSNLVLPFCQKAMVTRSIENGVFTITTNRTGTEARAGKAPLRFTGGSQVVSPKGEILASMGETDEGIVLATIDPSVARDKTLTPRNALLDDRRPDTYRRLKGETE